MRIGEREIGPHADVYVIAELGVNHDGSVERALALTDAAADAGADAVKLQFYRTDLLMSRMARLAAYQQAAGESDPVAMLRRLELPVDAMARVIDRAHRRRLHAIVTVFSVELAEEARALTWDAYKSASPDIIHRPLLDALAATGSPMIVSTGASDLSEVERAVSWLAPVRDRLALLQCVSAYPTPVEQAAITTMHRLRRFGVPVGYSDHTTGVGTGRAAVEHDATILEKHLTLSRAARGPDHAASLEPGEFALYVRAARSVRHWTPGPTREAAIPPPDHPSRQPEDEKVVLDLEADVRRASRQSIVTRRALRPGECLAREVLTFKRPGTGIEPWRIDQVVGRKLARPVEEDTPLTDDDLA